MNSDIFPAVLTIFAGGIAAGTAYFVLRWLKARASATASPFDDILLAAVGKPMIVTIFMFSLYIALTRFGILPETIAGFRSTST